MVGQPRNLRAVAQAVLTNPLPIVIPCHRVLGADGKPSNYVGGLPRKKYLLDLEARFHKLGGLDDNRVIGELTRRVKPARAVVKPAAKKRAVVPTRSSASTVSASLKAPKKRPR